MLAENERLTIMPKPALGNQKLFRGMCMRWNAYLMAIVIVICMVMPAYGTDSTPVQFSLIHPLQLFPDTTSVQGIRINLIYGVNAKVQGLDWGLINHVTQETKGLQLGAFPVGGVNITGDLQGLQLAGAWVGANIANGHTIGIQLVGILGGINKARTLQGIQLAGIFGVNYAQDLKGGQVSGIIGVNIANDLKGVQCALICNQAETVQGLQLGLVNVCTRMYGVQIGLVNIIKQGPLPIFPIVNAQF